MKTICRKIGVSCGYRIPSDRQFSLGSKKLSKSNFQFLKKVSKKTKYWPRKDGFTFSPEVKVYLLFDSFILACMQSIERTFYFEGISYTAACHELVPQLISIVSDYQAFFVLRVILFSYK